MKEELRKLFRGKLVFCLIGLSLAVNVGLFFMQKDKIGMFKLFDDFGQKYGNVVNDESMADLERLWKKTPAMNISWEEYKENINGAKRYLAAVKNGEMKTGDMALAYCSLKHLEGRAAALVREEFARLDGRLEEAAAEELTFFPPRQARVFDFISIYLLFAITLEGIAAAVVVSLYSVDLERSSRTLATVYSTRRGKKLVRDKLLASVMGSLICFFLIVVLTYLLAGLLFPVNTIMDTLISNPMVNLKGAPCIADGTMTIGAYMLVSLAVSGILTVIYSLGSLAIGLRAKNGYFAFGILLAVLGILKVISTAAPASTPMFFLSQYNPMDMTLKAGTWFLYNGNNFSPLGYEWKTLSLWLCICTAGCLAGVIRFGRKEIRG